MVIIHRDCYADAERGKKKNLLHYLNPVLCILDPKYILCTRRKSADC